MIFPQVTLQEWMRRFPGLEPESAECSCGKRGQTTVPVISKDWVGLAMPKCICGDEIPGAILKSRNPKIQAAMESLLGMRELK